MTNNDKIVLSILAVSILTVLFFATETYGAGFREQESWKFRTPYERAVRLSIDQHRELKQGEYYHGSHASRYQQFDVNIENVDAGHLQFQETTTIGNYSDTRVNGDGNILRSDDIQSSDEQNSLNGATAGRANTTSHMLNVEAAQ